MQVDVLAHTTMVPHVVEMAYDYEPFSDDNVTNADGLGEAAGRICYKSFNRPNPSTATNAGYMANILNQGHYSVTEHASVTFLVRGVSRSLLADFTRHRHISFSVVSQRYVNHAGTTPVLPPAVTGTEADTMRKNMVATVEGAYSFALAHYEELYRKLRAQGLGLKAAREAARSVLPNATPVDMVVSGNLRAWRDVLGKRWSVHADAEIREMAGLILGHLRTIAPNTVQDIPATPYGS